MKFVRRMPIVGDVHLGREEWPATPEDWDNLWNLPQPIKVSKLSYSINVDEMAFDALSISFAGQDFDAYEIKATNRRRRIVKALKLRQEIKIIKIKQRNTPEGISKICGLCLINSQGQDMVNIDLCPNLGQWRVQTLYEGEHIIGLHSYVVADDESVAGHSNESMSDGERNNDVDDASWLDSLGFIVYQFPVKQKFVPQVKRPPGRPRVHPRK